MFPEIRPLGTDRDLVQDSLYGPVAGLRPGSAGLSNGAAFQIDSDGFVRYTANSAEAPAWLFLGDSVTMGIGVDPDSSFAGRVAGDRRFRILNPSLIGYDGRDYVAVFNAIADSMRQGGKMLSRATIFWCLNDAYLPASHATLPGTNVRRIASPLLVHVQRHLRSYQLLRRIAADRPRTYLQHDHRLYHTEAADSAAARLERVRDRASAHGVDLDVVLLPYEYQLRTSSEDVFAPQRRMRRELERLQIPVYDASEHLQTHLRNTDASSSDLYLYGDGIHFNRLGHRLLADYVRSTLLNKTSEH